MKERLFTKSAFKVALKCPAQLNYYNDSHYANQEDTDEFLQALAKGGFQVGELAKVYCEVPPENDLEKLRGNEAQLKRTTELMQQEDCIIAEAAFKFENMFVRADIIRKMGNQIELIEVKAKSWDPKKNVFAKQDNQSGKYKITGDILPYVYDVAFQKYVIIQALAKLFPESTFHVKAALMLVNKNVNADVNGMNQCFGIVNENGRTTVKRLINQEGIAAEDLINYNQVVTPFFEVDEACNAIIAGDTLEQAQVLHGMTFVPFVTEMARRYCAGEQHYCELSSACFKCPFYADELTPGADGFNQCWKEMAGLSDTQLKGNLLDSLWGGGNTHLRGQLLAARKYLLDQIAVDDLGSTEKKASGLTHVERKLVQIALTTKRPEMLGELAGKVKDGVYLDIEGLRDEMSSWKFPLHMIDFETSASALPFYDGMHPYEAVAFQFSHHIIESLDHGKTYTIRHAGQYINKEKGKFPNFEFLRRLKQELEQDNGSIFRYAPHENTILRQIYDQLNYSNEPDREELKDFVDSITYVGPKEHRIFGPRNMIDLKEMVVKYYWHPIMQGSNSIKYVLPAVLNSSKLIQEKYSRPIYGSEITSWNIPNNSPIAWIEWGKGVNGEREVVNPYKHLPPIAEYFPESSRSSVEKDLANGEDDDSSSVNNGGAALWAYEMMQFGNCNRIEALSKALLRYCELDTLAMVFIWEYFNEQIKSADVRN